MSTGWIPPRPEVLDKLKAGLQSGRYQNDRSSFKKDLKEDLSLYVYCLRELMKIVRQSEEHSEEKKNRNFAKVLDTMSLETFQSIFNVDVRSISTHSISETSDIQAQRIEETFLSASASEALAGASSLDPELGFSCAVLRQLGLTLIAWNYPRVYARACRASDSSTDLDSRLKKTLGFTPTLLATRLTRDWSLSEVLTEAVATPAGRVLGLPRMGKETDNTAQLLSKICCVGEALARAKHPETYPSALTDWESAQEAVAAYLGPKGVDTIFKQAEQYIGGYRKQSPELFKMLDPGDTRDEIVNVQHGARLLEQNVYLSKLSDHERVDFASIYMRMRANKIDDRNIRELATILAPQYGFQNLVIFTVEPEKKILSAAIHVGSCFSDRLRPVRVDSRSGHLDFIASAYSLRTPTREDRIRDGETISCLAGSLGTNQKVGVLYMETNEETQIAEGRNSNLLFQVFRRAIGDSLNLN